jgi:hypothetical protein
MGWGQGRFPVIGQLNAIANPGNVSNTRTFVRNTYQSSGASYTIGDLCYDWSPRDPTTPPNPNRPDPPWQNATQHPWNQPDAAAWKDHCQNDLNISNSGDDQGSPSSNTVEQDLTNWVREAILAQEQIIYRFRPDSTLNPPWKADRARQGQGPWRITVSGPGW